MGKFEEVVSKFEEAIKIMRLIHISFITEELLKAYMHKLEEYHNEEIEALQKELNVSRVANESLRERIEEFGNNSRKILNILDEIKRDKL